MQVGRLVRCVCVSINPHPFLTRNIQNTLPARTFASSGKQAKFPDYLISGQAQLHLNDQFVTIPK